MKKLLIVVTMLMVFILSACSPIAQQFVDLPQEQELAIVSIFIAVFAIGFDWLIGRASWLGFFRQYQEAWAVAAATLFVQALENALLAGSESVSIPAVSLLIAVALYLLGRTLLMRNKVQGFVKS